MATIKVNVDLTEFLDECFDADTMEELIKEMVNEEVLKVVKRDPRYKDFLKRQAEVLLKSMDSAFTE